MLEAEDGIAAGAPATRHASPEADDEVRRFLAVVDQVRMPGAEYEVRALPAAQRVIARGAQQRVRTRAAHQKVVRGIADQQVVAGAADGALDIDHQVALGTTAGGVMRQQADGEVRGLGGIDSDVEAGAAIEHIGATGTGQRIGALGAEKLVRLHAAGQRIIAAASDNPFDAVQRIAIGAAAARRAEGEVDDEIGRLLRVGEKVGARAALDHVATGATGQRVRARGPAQRIGARTADQQVHHGAAKQAVIPRAAHQALDRDQAIGLRRAAEARAKCQVHRDHGRVMGVGDDVESLATIQQVTAAAAHQRVRTRAAGDLVRTRRAGQIIVAAAADEAVHALDRIAFGIATAGGAGAEINHDISGFRRVGQQVAARPAIHQVGARAADQRIRASRANQRIGAGTTFDLVVSAIAEQAITACAAHERLDPQQAVAFRPAASAAPGCQVDGDIRRLVLEGSLVDAVPTIQQVRARAAEQRILRLQPLQRIRIGGPGQAVPARRSDHL